MSDLSPDVDPAAAGFDPARLTRIDDLLHGYVDSRMLSCTQLLVTRGDNIVYHDRFGFADLESGRPTADDTVFRIYSMTKPITSVALMMLYEEGKVLLEDPIEKYLPALANRRVWVSGAGPAILTRPAERSIRVKDLLTHTAGLTYGFQDQHQVDALYREHALGDFGTVPAYDNQGMVELLGQLPLQFSPGTAWCYSMATDVIGALVEVLSGKTLDVYFRDHILEPLGMTDTAFWVDAERAERLATNYAAASGGLVAIDTRERSPYLHRPSFLGGGGGLVSTMADYHRFVQMLRRGGELDGVRLLSPRTIRYMTTNHLPDGKLLNELGQAGFSEVAMDGIGFGLGFSVNVDPTANSALGSPGDYGWGGAASTVFSIDPVEDTTMIFLTQLMPSNTLPIRRQLRAAITQALID